MKFIIKTVAAIILTAVTVCSVQVISSVLSLDVGEKYNGEYLSVHRFGYTHYKIELPFISASISTNCIENAISEYSSYSKLLSVFIPQSCLLLTEHISGRLSHISKN